MSGSAPPTGFSPPPYPHERLSELKASAVGRFGIDGLVDCSIGTPCDPPPASVLAAMAASGSERGYPTSPGSIGFRSAAVRWLNRRFGVSIDAERQVAACVGTKEFVASTAHYLRLRSPDRDTVLYPAVSYPTYAMGALLAGCRPVPVPELPGGGPDLSTVDKVDAARALMVWTNSPSNPTGFLSDLEGAARWARDQDIPMFSDECYAEFTWDGRPRSVLEWGTTGVIAVHSLSKRSNLAGVRAGFYAGDPELVAYLVEVRRHAGLMVPGPVQAGAAVALDDDEHVLDQRRRYLERLSYLAQVLGHAGLPVELPAGGFYLWVAVPTSASRGGWSVTEALALESGLLVSPGEFYGPLGAGFVRVAAVQPMDRLELVAERLAGRDLMAAL